MLTYVENQLKTVKKSWKTVENNTFTCRRYHLQRIAAQDDTRNITKAQLYTTAKYTRLSFYIRGLGSFPSSREQALKPTEVLAIFLKDA
jgi:hypothetical protein